MSIGVDIYFAPRTIQFMDAMHPPRAPERLRASSKRSHIMQVTYTTEGQTFQAEITRIENGVIFARTIQDNGDFTEEHELPLAEITRTIGR